ncbi:MAG: GNAT family N-acetyltransferase [Nitrospirota bacterium]
MVYRFKDICVEVLTVDELTPDLIEQWISLEQRSIEGNAFLSPHFIIPALRYMTPEAKALLVLLFHETSGRKLLTGLGAFEYTRGTTILPIPHVKAYRCCHSYLTGLLIDERYADQTLEAFFSFFTSTRPYCWGVEFIYRNADTQLGKHLNKVTSELSIPWVQSSAWERPILIPDSEQSDAMLAPKRKKSLRRSKTLLAKHGDVRWNIVQGDLMPEAIDRFLNLEHQGWKKNGRTSLRSHPREEAFYRDMVRGFAQEGRACFSELSVQNQVIASISHLISARTGYTFKLGWDPEFSSYSPGNLSFVELMQQAGKQFPDLQYIDSGSDEGSFVEKVWHDRHTLVSGCYVMRNLARPIATSMDAVRRIRRWIHELQHTEEGADYGLIPVQAAVWFF